MSKVKRIIEIDKDLYESIAGKNTDTVEPREVVRSFQATIADAIADSKPYDDSGECISRSALIREIGRTDYWYKGRTICNIIDELPTIEPKHNYDKGYLQGMTDMKSDIITLIANEYTSHGELIPSWLTIGEIKVADRQKKSEAK